MAPEKKRLLVIDDEVALCEVLKARLETFGYSVTTANDGRHGWEQALKSPPDLILLDIRMPEEDGYTFLRRLRSFRNPENQDQEKKIRQLPVIVVTATGEGMKSLFEQEQISAYITKPIDSAVIKRLIEETLNPGR